MMGFVYKDFVALHKQIRWYLLFLILYSFLVTQDVFPASILPGIVVMMGLVLPISSVAWDDQAQWDKFAACAPAGRKGIVGGKYVFAVLLTLGGSAAVTAVMLAMRAAGLIEDSGVEEIILTVLMCAAVTLLMDAVTLPIMLKYGAEKSRIISTLIFVGLFGFIILITQMAQRNLALPAPPAWLEAAMPGVVGLLGVGGFVVSYFISQGIYARKEF